MRTHTTIDRGHALYTVFESADGGKVGYWEGEQDEAKSLGLSQLSAEPHPLLALEPTPVYRIPLSSPVLVTFSSSSLDC